MQKKGICLLIGLLLTGCSGKPQGNLEQNLTEVVETYASRNEFSGSVLIAQNGTILLRRGFGWADRERRIRNAPETRFRIASLSKLLTRSAVLQLFDPESAVSEILPYYPNGNQIKIRYLIEHTSGIPDLHNEDPQFVNEESLQNKRTLDDLISRFSSRPLNFRPGTSNRYSNSGYVLLAKLIETKTHLSYCEAMKRLVFEKSGMNDSAAEVGEVGKLAKGYRRQSGQSLPAAAYDVSNYVGSGNIYATVDDLFRWEQAMVDGKLMNADALAEFGSVNHLGRIGGFRTSITRIPSRVKKGEDGIVIILLANEQESRVEEIANEVTTLILGKDLTAPSGQEINQMVGEYTGQVASEQVISAQIERDPSGPILRIGARRGVLKKHFSGYYFATDERGAINPSSIWFGEGGRRLFIDDGSALLQLNKVERKISQ